MVRDYDIIANIDGFGSLSGKRYINKFGRNPVINTAADEDIWDGGGIWVKPTADRVHSIVSTDIADDAASSGCRGVTIHGLVAGALTEELVTMDGTTPVLTTNSFGMIHRMFATSGLGSGDNVGAITATAATDSTVTAQISAGNNQTLMAIYVVPDDATAYLEGYYASVNKNVASTTANITLLAQESDGVARVQHVIGVSLDGTSYIYHRFHVPPKYAGGTLIKQQASVSANSTDISSGFDIVLV